MRTVALLLALCGTALAGELPDARLTPGVAVSALTKEKLCAKGFSTRSIRNVPKAVKDQAYAEYGLTRNKPPCPCEVDHLISLEVGGSNDIGNLWPQSYTTLPWNAHVKDKLENRMHKLLCNGTVTLEQAQSALADNWIISYARYMK